MSKKNQLIEDMRNKIKLEEYGLENVSIFNSLLFNRNFKNLFFSLIAQIFPIRMKDMTTVGILKNFKK